MATNFTSIPILDYSLALNPSTKPSFISSLQHALINVGFFYLSNTPVPPAEFDSVISYCPKFFDLPEDEKERIRMVNSPHFFGYSRYGAELTKGKVDQREQFDFGTVKEKVWKEGDPEHKKLWGPSLWPSEGLLPGFKAAYTSYVAKVEKLSFDVLALVAEALGLPPNAFDPFFAGGAQHRGKVVKYPVPRDDSSNQGVGPHYDGGFLTLLVQASDHRGLQVQNLAGDWVDAPPLPYTFVVNIGKALEHVTHGLARATSHQVLSPVKGSTPRYSIPFFQMISHDINVSKLTLPITPEILKLKETQPELKTDSVNYQEYDSLLAGEVALIGRVKSHPDVGERHYPDVFKRFFPNGLPAHGFAY